MEESWPKTELTWRTVPFPLKFQCLFLKVSKHAPRFKHRFKREKVIRERSEVNVD